MIRELEKIVAEIERADKILVVGHILPDGDDISSVISLKIGLERLGKDVKAVIDDDIPAYLLEIDGVKDHIIKYKELEDFNCDLIIVLDASSPDRIGRVQEKIGKKKMIVIDHHGTNTYFGDYNWVDTSYGATAQMVLRVNRMLGVKYDKTLATFNLMGIATDTGFFRYSNADSKVFKDASELISLGADIGYISTRLLENKPIVDYYLFRDVIDNLKLSENGLIACSHITIGMMEKYNIKPKDAPPFVSELRALKGIEVAVMFIEREPNKFHVSLRSKEWFDVSKVAIHFGGGGHPRAAGFTAETEDLEKTKEEVINYINTLLENELNEK